MAMNKKINLICLPLFGSHQEALHRADSFPLAEWNKVLHPHLRHYLAKVISNSNSICLKMNLFFGHVR